jgi:hypothetical protein
MVHVSYWIRRGNSKLRGTRKIREYRSLIAALLYIHSIGGFHRGVIILVFKRGGILIHDEPLEKHQENTRGGVLILAVKSSIILLLTMKLPYSVHYSTFQAMMVASPSTNYGVTIVNQKCSKEVNFSCLPMLLLFNS